MINERDLLLFNKDAETLSGLDLETRAIELVNFIEDSNLKIEDYRHLHFYSSFTGLLNENNKLKEEYREINVLNEDTNINTFKEEVEILHEAPAQTKRKKITDLVLNIVKTLDVTGINYNNYYNKFTSMTDEQFTRYMNNFVRDPEENIYLEILPNKSEPSMAQIEEALRILNIPTEEYVYYRHDGYKDNPIRTREKVPTGLNFYM